MCRTCNYASLIITFYHTCPLSIPGPFRPHSTVQHNILVLLKIKFSKIFRNFRKFLLKVKTSILGQKLREVRILTLMPSAGTSIAFLIKVKYQYTRVTVLIWKAVLACDMITFLQRLREVRVLIMTPNTGTQRDLGQQRDRETDRKREKGRDRERERWQEFLCLRDNLHTSEGIEFARTSLDSLVK